jgi:hypothetical protein
MRSYVLYVFQLRASVARKPRIPPRKSSKPYLYVGYTSKPAEERLEEHRVGRYVADRRWVPYWKRPRPDLSARWPTYATQAEALAGEAALAKALGRRGFTIVNKTGKAIEIPSGRRVNRR